MQGNAPQLALGMFSRDYFDTIDCDLTACDYYDEWLLGLRGWRAGGRGARLVKSKWDYGFAKVPWWIESISRFFIAMHPSLKGCSPHRVLMEVRLWIAKLRPCASRGPVRRWQVTRTDLHNQSRSARKSFWLAARSITVWNNLSTIVRCWIFDMLNWKDIIKSGA